MFRAANPYDEIVNKATAETLTSENWELNIDVCDKVSGEGELGARNCVAAIQKRLIHRNANVQLYSLTLADALAKNCGNDAHRELASRSFTQTLHRVVTDRNTHATVRNKTLGLIKEWANDFTKGQDADEAATLGLVAETMEQLKAQGYRFDDGPSEDAAPAEPSSEQLRREDEELRRVLELSMQDVGGRGTHSGVNDYSGASGSGSGSGPSGGPSVDAGPSRANGPNGVGTAAAALTASNVDKYLPDAPAQSNGPSSSSNAAYSSAPSGSAPAAAPSTAAAPAPAPEAAGPAKPPSRVRALYDFAPTEVGELSFQKGDVIRVLDSVYEHWWRGELRGEAGIFPVNYVEILPDPTPAEIQREAEQEAKIFAQAHDIDRLLAKLRTLDPATSNLAEDEELQDLYQSSLAMRPKIVRLIDRYSTKVEELRAMNEKFVRARSTFDGMMETSLAQHNPNAQVGAYSAMRPEYSGVHQGGAASSQYYQGVPQQQQYPQQQPQQQQPYYPQQQSTPQQPIQDPQQAQQAQWYTQQQPQPVQPQQPAYEAAPQQHYQQHPQQHQQAYVQSPYQQPAQAQAQVPGQGQGQGSGSGYPANAYPQQQQHPQVPQIQVQYAGGSAPSPSPASAGAPADPREDEKRRLYEQARREAEAYHAAYGPQGQQGAVAGGSGS